MKGAPAVGRDLAVVERSAIVPRAQGDRSSTFACNDGPEESSMKCVYQAAAREMLGLHLAVTVDVPGPWLEHRDVIYARHLTQPLDY